jgi:hypothetical protein
VLVLTAPLHVPSMVIVKFCPRVGTVGVVTQVAPLMDPVVAMVHTMLPPEALLARKPARSGREPRIEMGQEDMAAL